MYISLKKLSKKYDMHPDTIRRKKLIEWVHYIKIGKLIRYNIEEMHKFLVDSKTYNKNSISDSILDKLLI